MTRVGPAPMIDPTQNVLDLVKAESKYQDAMRQAETRRIDDLASMRVHYEGIIEVMRTNSLKLLADQLKENKADSSERMSKMEQFRWESGGSSRSFKEGWGYLVGLIGIGAALAALFYR